MHQPTPFPFILSIKEGDNIFQCIADYASCANLKSAIFTGIGAISNITMGFYHRESGQHTTRTFNGAYEIASLNGSVTVADNDWFVHIHAAISDDQFQLFGGHLISAEASASTEISIIPLNYQIKRHKHSELAIKVIAPFSMNLI